MAQMKSTNMKALRTLDVTTKSERLMAASRTGNTLLRGCPLLALFLCSLLSGLHWVSASGCYDDSNYTCVAKGAHPGCMQWFDADSKPDGSVYVELTAACRVYAITSEGDTCDDAHRTNPDYLQCTAAAHFWHYPDALCMMACDEEFDGYYHYFCGPFSYCFEGICSE
jgi:hypothetical protein